MVDPDITATFAPSMTMLIFALAFERLTDKKLKITDFRAVGKKPLFPQNYVYWDALGTVFKMLYFHLVLLISLNFKSLYTVQISNYRNSKGTEKHNNKRLILHKGNQPRMFLFEKMLLH